MLLSANKRRATMQSRGYELSNPVIFGQEPARQSLCVYNSGLAFAPRSMNRAFADCEPAANCRREHAAPRVASILDKRDTF